MLGEIVKNAAGTTLLTAGGGASDPAGGAITVTPDDAIPLAVGVRGVYVGTGGTLSVKFSTAATIAFLNVPNGTLLPIAPTLILATGTTADNIVALL